MKSSSDLYESDQKMVCDSIVKRISSRFFFPQLSHCDMLCIGHALETSSEPVIGLAFAGYTYNENQVVSLLGHIDKAGMYSLDLLDIGFLICDSGTEVLCKVLQCAKNIDNLVLNIDHYYPLFASARLLFDG